MPKHLRKLTLSLLLSLCFGYLSAQECGVVLSDNTSISCDTCVVCADGQTDIDISIVASIPDNQAFIWALYSEPAPFDDLNPVRFLSIETAFTPVSAESTPSCTVCPSILGIMVDACDDGTHGEGQNEFMVIHSGSGFNVSNLQVDLGFEGNSINPADTDINFGANPCQFRDTPEDLLMQNLQNQAPGCTFIPAGIGTTVPGNAIVVAFTSSNATKPYDLSSLCLDDQNIYVIQSQCTRTPTNGAFSNNTLLPTPFSTSLFLEGCSTPCQTTFTYDRSEIGNSTNQSTFAYLDEAITSYVRTACNVPVNFPVEKPDNLFFAQEQITFSCADIETLRNFRDRPVYLVGFLANPSNCFRPIGQTKGIPVTFDANCGATTFLDLPTLCSGQTVDLRDFVENPNNEPLNFQGQGVNGNLFTAPALPGDYPIRLEGACEGQEQIINVLNGQQVRVRDGVFCANAANIDLDFLVIEGAGIWRDLDGNQVTNEAVQDFTPGNYQLIYEGCGSDTANLSLTESQQISIATTKICKGNTDFTFSQLIEEDFDVRLEFENQNLSEAELLALEAGIYQVTIIPFNVCVQPLTVDLTLIEDPEDPIRDATVCRETESFFLIDLLETPSLGTWQDITNFPTNINNGALNLNNYATGTINLRFIPSANNETLCQSAYEFNIRIVEGNDIVDTIQTCGNSLTLDSGLEINQDTSIIAPSILDNCTVNRITNYLFTAFDTVRSVDQFQTCDNQYLLPDGTILTPTQNTNLIQEIDSATCQITEIETRVSFSNGAGGLFVFPDTTLCGSDSILIGGQAYSTENMPPDTINLGTSCDSQIVTTNIVFQPLQVDTFFFTACQNEMFRFVDEAGNELDVFDSSNGEVNNFYTNYTYENGCQGEAFLNLRFIPVLIETRTIEAPCDVQEFVFMDSLFTPERNTIDFDLDTTLACQSILRVNVLFNDLTVVEIRDTAECGADTYTDPFGSQFIQITREIPDTIIFDLDINGCLSGGKNYKIFFPPTDTLFPELFVCTGETVEINNQTYSEENLPEIINVGINQFGCDSFINTTRVSFNNSDTIRQTFDFCFNDTFVLDRGVDTIQLSIADFDALPSARVFNLQTGDCEQVTRVEFADIRPAIPNQTIDTCFLDSVVYLGTTFYPDDNQKTIEIGTGDCQTPLLFTVNFTTEPSIQETYLDTADCDANSFSFELFDETILVQQGQPTDTVQLSTAACEGDFYPYSIQFRSSSDTSFLGDIPLCSSDPLLFTDSRKDTTYMVSAPGSFFIPLTNAAGCDSILTGTLSRSEGVSTAISGINTICLGDSTTINFEVLGVQSIDLNILENGVPILQLENVQNGDSLVVSPSENTQYEALIQNSDALPCQPLANASQFLIRVEELSLEIEKEDVGCQTPGQIQLITDAEHEITWFDGDQSDEKIFEAAGSYTFNINKNGCQRDFTVNLDKDSATALVDIPALDCADSLGSIQFTVSNPRPGLLSRLSMDSIEQQFDFEGTGPFLIEEIAPSTYQLFITDAANCILFSDSVEIKEPLRVRFPPVSDSVLFQASTVELSVNQGFPYELEWTPDQKVTCLNNLCDRVELEVSEDTRFEFGVSDTAICSSEKTAFTYFIEENGVSYPNAIIADDENGFMLYSKDSNLEINTLQVYDRWGTVVYEINDISPNDKMSSWKGRFRGKLLPGGVYLFNAQVSKSNGAQSNIFGDILLLRK